MATTHNAYHGLAQSADEVHHEPTHDTALTATPLLDADADEAETCVPQGWPTSPNRVRHSLAAIASQGFFDIVLILCSASFLAFAQFVVHYDQAPTSENPKATNMLRSATKYVRLLIQGYEDAWVLQSR